MHMLFITCHPFYPLNVIDFNKSGATLYQFWRVMKEQKTKV